MFSLISRYVAYKIEYSMSQVNVTINFSIFCILWAEMLSLICRHIANNIKDKYSVRICPRTNSFNNSENGSLISK